MTIFGKRMLCASAGVVAAAALLAGSAPRPATALHARGRARAAPRDLRSQACPDARQRDRRRARAHPLRFLRQCLRRLRAAVPAGVGARQRRGQGHAQRPALHHLGRRRRQEAASSIRRTTSTRGWSTRVDGQAERQSDKIAVRLTKPDGKKFDLEAAIVFPTDHMRRIIEAARAGKTILEFPVYDGSETGEKVYNTLTVIGQRDRAERAHADRRRGRQADARRHEALAGDRQLFRQGGEDQRRADAGLCDQVRALRERRLARAVLDYNDFVISGEMTSLEIKDIPAVQMTDDRRALASSLVRSIERQALDHGIVAEFLAQAVDGLVRASRGAPVEQIGRSAPSASPSAETPMPIRRNLVPSVSRASRSRPAAKIRAASWVGWSSERARVRMRKSAVLSLSVTVEPASSLVLQPRGDRSRSGATACARAAGIRRCRGRRWSPPRCSWPRARDSTGRSSMPRASRASRAPSAP